MQGRTAPTICIYERVGAQGPQALHAVTVLWRFRTASRQPAPLRAHHQDLPVPHCVLGPWLGGEVVRVFMLPVHLLPMYRYFTCM